jgi:predicted N-acetyltransferase YhbS
MQSLVQRLWSPASRFHIGDMAWGWFSAPEPEETFAASLWEEGGDILAWAWAEMPGHLDLLVDPDHPDLIAEVLDWFEATAVGRDLTCLVMDGDTVIQQALERRRYARQADGPYFTRHCRRLVDLPHVVLPDGFTVASVSSGQAEVRAQAHRAGWSDFGSRLSAESYAAIMQAYPYRPETDLVVVAPGGEWVASALGWYDEQNAVGLVEPVSCHPVFRRRGLGRAVDVALLHAFHALGATAATVLPRGDRAYPVPGLLYRSIGYEPAESTAMYSRTVR